MPGFESVLCYIPTIQRTFNDSHLSLKKNSGGGGWQTPAFAICFKEGEEELPSGTNT